jgi:CheY-like chemotaxis protein
VILQASERASVLTQQLLVFSRRHAPRVTTFDVNEVVRSIDRMLQRVIGEHIDLTVSLSAEPVRVRTDPAQLEQVLVNLAVNARDAMPEGGRLTLETRSVELDADFGALRGVPLQAGRYAMIAVSDDGVGMDRKTQERIFDPFFTTKPVGQGTGLGLSMVYGIVKQAGGAIWVYSEPQRGSVFKIYLPQMREAVDEPALERAEVATLHGDETVLVIEDDPMVREAACRILSHGGYTVLAATTGEEAFVIASDAGRTIDVVLCDVVLPGASAVETRRQLATVLARAEFVYMSGYAGGSSMTQAVLAEGDVFVPKPFTSRGLLQAVRTAIDRRRTTPSGRD